MSRDLGLARVIALGQGPVMYVCARVWRVCVFSGYGVPDPAVARSDANANAANGWETCIARSSSRSIWWDTADDADYDADV